MKNDMKAHDLDLLGEYDELELIELGEADGDDHGAGWFTVITTSSWVCGVTYTIVGPTTACSKSC